MRFNPGYRIKVGQREFSVTGRISYRGNDGSVWDEYSLRDASGRTAWLSVDDEEGEYILSEATGLQHPPEGFSLYWQGSERVTGVSGRVDVEPGDEAVCSDYEDHSGRIYSVERWDDETEYSLGTILDPDKIIRISGGGVAGWMLNLPFLRNSSVSPRDAGIALLCVVVPIIFALHGSKGQDINSYLESQPDKYVRVTSLTSSADNHSRATVYSAATSWAGGRSPGDTADDIVSNCTDEFTRIRKNDMEPEDGSVSMLTRRNYVFIYRDADAGNVLVQVEPRKYSYHSVPGPYHSPVMSERFYRAFYHRYAYPEDLSSFGRGGSPYESYKSAYALGNSYDHSLESKSVSIRQQSLNRRRSSGGGFHGGK